jgi:hypothetical protein
MANSFLAFPKNGYRIPLGAASTTLTVREHRPRRNRELGAFAPVNGANACRCGPVKLSMVSFAAG